MCANVTSGSRQCKRKMVKEPGNRVSPRWNPTHEQIQCLEELYCSGTITPTAKQIQQIAAKLQRFGKIEGKNVFYWFQNHKSRERHRQHRKLKLGLGLSRASADLRQVNNWARLSNSCTSSEESLSLQKAVVAECNADKGIRFEGRQRALQQRGSRTLTANARWRKMEMPPATTAPETLLETRGHLLVEAQIFDTLVTAEHNNVCNLELVEDERRREPLTLQLFPVYSQVLQSHNDAQDDVESQIPFQA